MKKIIEGLYGKTENILNESLVSEVQKLLGISEEETEVIEDKIDELSFAHYLELSNAASIGKTDIVREILGLDDPQPDELGFETYGEDDFDMHDDLEEADNPFQAITPPSQQLPSKTLAQKTQSNQQQSQGQVDNDEESPEEKRKEIEDLDAGDEIELIDIDGEPVAAKVLSNRGPGDTVVVQGKGSKRYNVQKDSITGTPKITENWDDENDSVEAVRSAIIHRVKRQHLDLIDKYGIDKVMAAIDDAAEYYGSGGLEEIGSSDVSAFVDSVRRSLGEPSMFEDTDLARMKMLAGIKETASSGATGAGAIASAPVAVGGMQKRENPSIYASKPKPKPRKTGKKDNGVGRNKKS